MPHRILRLIKDVDKTHCGLGKLCAFLQVALKAGKFILVVSVAGTGKTTAMQFIAKSNPDGCITVNQFTRSGLAQKEKELNGFRGSLFVDDLGNIDTGYSLHESIKSGIMLCYGHELSKYNASININIQNFHGSMCTSIQPVKMPMIISGTDWEAVMQDKTIRYYHLIRAIKPNMSPILAKIDWGIDINKVKIKLGNNEKYKRLLRIGLLQWGRSRATEHINDLLKSLAAIDRRLRVSNRDLDVLLMLIRPLMLESYIIDKEGFESEKTFYNDHLCMLTELASYNELTHDNVASDFKVNLRTVERLLSKVRIYYTPDPKDKKLLHPSVEALEVLKICGYR